MDYIGKSFMLQGVATLAAFVAVLALTGNLDAAIVAMGAAALAVLLCFDLPHTRKLEAVSVRFDRAERWLHWVNATLVLVLIAIGSIMYIGALSGLVGRRLLVSRRRVPWQSDRYVAW